MHLTQKEKRAQEQRICRKRGQTEAMTKIRDRKTQYAKEAFRRPAFQGTELEKKND